MSLRMNLYGFRLASLVDRLGSGNPDVLDAARSLLSKSLRDEADLVSAQVWLETLVCTGYPVKYGAPAPHASENGGLIVSHSETETHAFVAWALMQATAGPDLLDLSEVSSVYTIDAITTLYDESRACGFLKSRDCSVDFITSLSSLQSGTPLFGDEFRSDWSFYSILENRRLTSVIPVMAAACRFERIIPDHLPPEVKSSMRARLSDQGRSFADEFSRWLGEIRDSGLDAFLMWW